MAAARATLPFPINSISKGMGVMGGEPVPEDMTEPTVRRHGLLFAESGWKGPRLVTRYDVNARLTFTDIKAHEYIDHDGVLREKVRALAAMIRSSKNAIAFTGAGISTAAGIDDYASKAKSQSVVNRIPGDQDQPAVPPKAMDWKDARPTKAHRSLVALFEAGLLKHWIQQNHDSLPQKAGMKQYALNEIHGSLHDPANPVVPYEGTLRDDLNEWMQEWQDRTDLVLAMGTSLSGFNCDRVPAAAAKRFLKQQQAAQVGGTRVPYGQATQHGLVIINLQRTPYDDQCALRIYGTLDVVTAMLVEELQLEGTVRPMETVYAPVVPAEAKRRQGDKEDLPDEVYYVPFKPTDGTPASQGETSKWDLRAGKRVRLTGGPYAGDVGTIMGKNDEGHIRIRFEESVHPVFNVLRRPFSLWLGTWWIEMATSGRGIVPGGPIPFVNTDK